MEWIQWAQVWAEHYEEPMGSIRLLRCVDRSDQLRNYQFQGLCATELILFESKFVLQFLILLYRFSWDSGSILGLGIVDIVLINDKMELVHFFRVILRRLVNNCRRFGTFCRFHLHWLKFEVYFTLQPMKMEPTEGSETSAIINQTPGNYPKEN